VFAEEAGEVQQIVGVVRCRCEVAGRGWHDADALEEEVRGLNSAAARRTITTRTTARRAVSGEARPALEGATGELVLVLGELYRAGCSDGLVS